MSKSYDVIVVGNYDYDLVFTGLSRLPQLGLDTVGSGFALMPGGTYNSVVAMHRLGLSVGWAGDFGNDLFSRSTLEYARAEGLDSDLFVVHQKPLPRVSVVASFPQDRAFISYYSPDPEIPAGLKALARASAKALYIPGVYYGSAFEAGVMLIRSKKIKLVMDGGSAVGDSLKNPALLRAIKKTDLFMPNSLEVRRLTGEADLEKGIAALGRYCPVVVVKDGPNGSFLYKDGSLIHKPGIVVDAVETTGAGDCYNAGFVKAWLDGLPLEDCLMWGNVVGGLSTTVPGGTGRRITVADVNEWLAKKNK